MWYSITMEKMKIAKIVNTHGLKGQLKLLPLIDDKKIFNELKTFEITGISGEFECEKMSPKNDMFLLKIKGFDDINLVENFKGRDIVINQDDIVLQDGQYLVTDLIGSKIMFEGQEIGTIKSIENYGASDVITFVDGKKEKSVPFVDDFFDEIDVKNKVLIANEHFFEGVV